MNESSKPVDIPSQKNDQHAKSAPINILSTPPLTHFIALPKNFVGSYKSYLKLVKQQQEVLHSDKYTIPKELPLEENLLFER